MANNNYQEYVTKVFLNAEQAENTVDQLKAKLVDLRKKQQEALAIKGDEGTKKWKAVTKEVRATEAELKKLSTTSQVVNRVLRNLDKTSPRELKNTIKAISNELASGRVERGTEMWHALQEQLKSCKTELQGIKAESEAASKGGFLERSANFLNKNWGAITQFIGGFTQLSMTVRQATQTYADLEESMANVRKYTGQTDEEIHAMNEEFKQIDTRTSIEGLNELAGAAGRLGITSHDKIMEFVDAADKIGVALGDDLGNGAVDKIGKLAMAFGEDDKMGLRGAMLATGSAINELSANSSANAGYLVEFAARLGGVGKQAGLTQAQIMGLGSVMDENMLQDEMASTALSQLITKMITDTETFARLAGQPIDEFSDMVKNRMNDALLTFFDAMKAKGGFTELAPMFAEMGLNGQRASTVLSVFADKIADVRKNQEVATQAYKEATSVGNEFDVQNNTIQAGIDKNIKQFKSLSAELGQELMPVVKYTITLGGSLVKILSTLVPFIVKHSTALIALTAAIVTYKVQMTLANNATKIAIALEPVHTALIKAKNLVVGVYTRQVTLAAAAQKIWNATVAAFPLATAVAVFTALLSGFKSLHDKYSDVNRLAKEFNGEIAEENKKYDQQKQKIATLLPIAQNEKEAKVKRNQAIQELKRILPDYFKDLDLEKAKLYNVAEAQEAANKKMKESIRQKSRQTIAQYNLDARTYKNRFGQDHTKDITVVKNEWNIDPRSLKIMKKKLDEERVAALAAEKALRSLNETEKKTVEDPKEDKGNNGGGGGGNGGNTGNTDGGTTTTAKPVEAIPDEEMAKLAYQYSQRNITYQEFLEKRKELTRKYITDKEKQEDAITKLNEEEIEQQRVAQAALLKAQYYDPSSDIYQNEAALNEALYENDMDALAARIAAQKEGSAEWIRLMAERDSKEAQQATQGKEDLYRQLDEMRSRYEEASAEEQMQAELDALDKIAKVISLKAEEIEKIKQGIREKYQPQEEPQPTASDKANGIVEGAATEISYGDDYGVSAIANLFQIVKSRREANEQLDALYQQDKDNAAVYDEAKKQNNQAMLNEIVNAANAAYSGINTIVSAASAYSQACSDYEVAKITADYDKQIEAAGNNSSKKEKLEKKKDEAIAAAKTKANKRAMKIEVAQAIASTALAAINAYSSTVKIPIVGPTLAPIAAGIATAAGMLQVATIKKQHQAEALGYYEGGFTGGSSYRKEAGVVHQGEFVANHQAVGNSSILPALQLIDYAQKHNTVSSLTGEDVSRALGQGASSPIVAAPIVNVNTPDDGTAETMTEVKKTMQTLNDRLSSPIQAHISMDELDREQRKYKRLNS